MLTADAVWFLELEAAEALADPALVPALLRLERAWAGEDDRHTQVLARALRRCDPTAAARAAAMEAELLARVNRARPAGEELVLEGTYPRTTVRWSGRPVPVGTDVERLWAWTDPLEVDELAIDVDE